MRKLFEFSLLLLIKILRFTHSRFGLTLVLVLESKLVAIIHFEFSKHRSHFYVPKFGISVGVNNK